MLPAPRPFQDATAAFSGALERPHFLYRKPAGKSPFHAPLSAAECQDFTLRPLPGNTSLPAADMETPQSRK